MTRSRSTRVRWDGDDREEHVDALFGSMVSRAMRALNRDDVCIGTEAQASLVGLPLPALCLRYLFQSTTFPLSRITQITGQEGSAKSAFLYEIFRWHMFYGGGSVLAENENKDSPELRNSILQWEPQWMNRMVVIQTRDMEEWQDVFTTYTQVCCDAQDAAGGPGRTIPMCFGVDSITATAPRDEVESVRKEGHAKRGFALLANLIARYMRTMPARIKNYPFSIVGTNHLKPGQDARGLPTSSVPGGKSVKFMETYEIEMAQNANKDIDLLDYGGLRIVMTARKNSLGASRKRIHAELLWWTEAGQDGTWRQRTVWDWNTATIDLLLAFETAKNKKTIYNMLQEICDIRVVKKGQRLAYSNTLGVGSAQDPVHYRFLGNALEQRPDLLIPMYQVLGIHMRQPFTPGVDYRALLERARQQADTAEASQYQDVTPADLSRLSDDEGDNSVEASVDEIPDEPGDEEEL